MQAHVHLLCELRAIVKAEWFSRKSRQEAILSSEQASIPNPNPTPTLTLTLAPTLTPTPTLTLTLALAPTPTLP